MRVQTEPWASIVERYRELAAAIEDEAFAGMHTLVRQLASSPYAAGLYPYTSMHALVVAQTSEVLEGQERLRVEPRGTRIWFEYPGGRAAQPDWSTSCEPGEAFATVGRFLDRVGWFPRPLQSLRPTHDGTDPLPDTQRRVDPK